MIEKIVCARLDVLFMLVLPIVLLREMSDRDGEGRNTNERGDDDDLALLPSDMARSISA